MPNKLLKVVRFAHWDLAPSALGPLAKRSGSKTMKQIITMVLLLYGGLVYSCSELHWDWSNEEWIEESKHIYHGMIVSVSAPRSFIEDGEISPLINVAVSASRFMDSQIKLKVYETLKGKKKRVVKAKLSACAGGIPHYRQEVVLFRVSGIWHIKSHEAMEEDPIAKYVLMSLTNAGNK